MMPTWVYAIVIAANIPLYYLFYRFLFSDLDEFFQAIFYWFKPDLWSLFDGSFMEDFWAELKLGLFFVLCGGFVFLELQGIGQLMAG
jgi:hypothetical protein